MINPILITQVRQLRLNKVPFRKIAQELEVTKYAIETAIKELESEQLLAYHQTKVLGPQISNTAGQTSEAIPPDVDQTSNREEQTLQHHCQTTPQTLLLEQQAHVDTVKKAVDDGALAQKKQPTAAEKAGETTDFPPFYGFLHSYKRLLQELQRNVQQERKVWTHMLRSGYPLQLQNLRKQAQAHCTEYGIEYRSLLVSEVLEACERYLLSVLLTEPVNQYRDRLGLCTASAGRRASESMQESAAS